MSEWPNLPDDASAIDNDYIFQGLGATIRIFDKDLNYIKNFDINSSFAIQAVIADNTNKILYVAAGKSGIFIYNYSNIENIEYYGVIENIADDPGFLLGTPRDYIDAAAIALNGNYLYIADNGYGFRIIDMSSPKTPKYISGYRQDGKSEELTSGGYFDLCFFSFKQKNYLAVLDLYYGLKIFDVTDPLSYDNPVAPKTPQVSAESLINNPPPESPEDLIEPENDPDPVSKRDLRTAYYNTITLARDLDVKQINSNIYVFITSRSATEEKAAVAKLKVFDDEGNFITYTDPNDPEQKEQGRPQNIGRNDEILKGNSVKADSSFAFAADGKEGLQIVDMINATDETELGVYVYGNKYQLNSGYSNSYSVSLDNNYLFMSDLSKGLSKIDASNRQNPFEISFTGSFYSFSQIEENDGVLAAVNSESVTPGFLFFDASDKSEPKLIKKVNENNPLFVKKISDKIAAVTSSKIIIFTNIKTDPSTAASLDIQNLKTPLCMDVFGDYIYIGTDSGIDIYKYDLSGLVFVNTIEQGKIFQSVFIENEFLKLIAGSGAVIGVYNLNDPLNPSDTGLSAVIDAQITDIFSKSRTIYLSSGNNIFAFNLENLVRINQIDVATHVNSVFVDEGFLFAGTIEGIKIYSGANEASPKFLTSHSTKGNASKTILSASHVYSADSKGGISISKYDKTAGSDNSSPPSSGGSSSCFINSLF
jgi:hypothetical protein